MVLNLVKALEKAALIEKLEKVIIWSICLKITRMTGLYSSIENIDSVNLSIRMSSGKRIAQLLLRISYIKFYSLPCKPIFAFLFKRCVFISFSLYTVCDRKTFG